MPIDELPDDFIAAIQQDFQGQAEAVASAMFANSYDARAGCAEACAEVDARWSGAGCVAEGSSFSFGEIDYADSTYRDMPRYTMEVDVAAEMGCSCATAQ